MRLADNSLLHRRYSQLQWAPLFEMASPPSEDTSTQTSQISHSNTLKAQGNTLFSKGDYSKAVETYNEAFEGIKHTDVQYEQGVLKSNIAACWLKLEEWAKAVEEATAALECLGLADPGLVDSKRKEKASEGEGRKEDLETRNEESDKEEQRGEDEKKDGDSDVLSIDAYAERQKKTDVLALYGHTEEDVARMKAKALLRRATARSKLGGWAALQGADEGEKTFIFL
jgi:tetratricopeptide (TPR) repeat protein